MVGALLCQVYVMLVIQPRALNIFPDKYSVNWATPPTWKRLILGTCNYVYLRSRIQRDADGWSPRDWQIFDFRVGL